MSGDFEDGFGNKITMLAYANPRPENDRAAGYGLVRFKKDRAIRMECWPTACGCDRSRCPAVSRLAGHHQPAGQLRQAAVAYLPTIQMRGRGDPVVQVVDEGGEVVYTLRIKAVLPAEGVQTRDVHCSCRRRADSKDVARIKSLPLHQPQTITVDFWNVVDASEPVHPV